MDANTCHDGTEKETGLLFYPRGESRMKLACQIKFELANEFRRYERLIMVQLKTPSADRNSDLIIVTLRKLPVSNFHFSIFNSELRNSKFVRKESLQRKVCFFKIDSPPGFTYCARYSREIFIRIFSFAV